MQAKRIQVAESDIGVSFHEVSLDAPVDPREDINYHNIWGGVTVEPTTAGANSQGTWVLFVRKIGQISVNFNDANINGETQNAFIIACGVWSAANEMPFNGAPIHPETSRTLNAGDSLVLQVSQTGITTGTSSVKTVLCAHTTRK